MSPSHTFIIFPEMIKKKRSSYVFFYRDSLHLNVFSVKNLTGGFNTTFFAIMCAGYLCVLVILSLGLLHYQSGVWFLSWTMVEEVTPDDDYNHALLGDCCMQRSTIVRWVLHAVRLLQVDPYLNTLAMKTLSSSAAAGHLAALLSKCVV